MDGLRDIDVFKKVEGNIVLVKKEDFKL